jgi:hypothetical protein
MSAIRSEMVMPDLVERFPGFRSRWDAHLDFWEGTEAGLCNDIAEFALYIQETMEHDPDSETLPAAFSRAEELLETGTDEVKDAVATCFLENLVNKITPETAYTETFVSLLGPKSLQYCRDWNEFSGGGIAELEAT